MLTHTKPSRLLAVSDIHGHAEGLSLLLRNAGYNPSADRLILLGDYIDADPQTWSTLELVRSLVGQGAKALPGNQEMYLMKLKEQESETFRSQIDWLRTLPGYIVEDGHLFVHAGIRPGIPLQCQSFHDLTEIREDFWKHSPGGNHIVVFGHTPTFKLGAAPGALWFKEGRIGIDTGAKHGHRLTLLDVHGKLAYSCSTSPHNLYGDFRTELFLRDTANDRSL